MMQQEVDSDVEKEVDQEIMRLKQLYQEQKDTSYFVEGNPVAPILG